MMGKVIKGMCAILISTNGEYILQKRSNVPEIRNPGKIGLFGGCIEELDKDP